MRKHYIKRAIAFTLLTITLVSDIPINSHNENYEHNHKVYANDDTPVPTTAPVSGDENTDGDDTDIGEVKTGIGGFSAQRQGYRNH